jgi:hypothetical protein
MNCEFGTITQAHLDAAQRLARAVLAEQNLAWRQPSERALSAGTPAVCVRSSLPPVPPTDQATGPAEPRNTGR